MEEPYGQGEAAGWSKHIQYMRGMKVCGGAMSKKLMYDICMKADYEMATENTDYCLAQEEKCCKILQWDSSNVVCKVYKTSGNHGSSTLF